MPNFSIDKTSGTLYVKPKQCKYYHPHMETIMRYAGCLYRLKDCECGGLLHILLDDNNITDNDILFCLKNCLEHPEREESRIGQLICEEYLKLSMEQRSLLVALSDYFDDPTCLDFEDCDKCPMMECKKWFEKR